MLLDSIQFFFLFNESINECSTAAMLWYWGVIQYYSSLFLLVQRKVGRLSIIVVSSIFFVPSPRPHDVFGFFPLFSSSSFDPMELSQWVLFVIRSFVWTIERILFFKSIEYIISYDFHLSSCSRLIFCRHLILNLISMIKAMPFLNSITGWLHTMPMTPSSTAVCGCVYIYVDVNVYIYIYICIST